MAEARIGLLPVRSSESAQRTLGSRHSSVGARGDRSCLLHGEWTQRVMVWADSLQTRVSTRLHSRPELLVMPCFSGERGSCS